MLLIDCSRCGTPLQLPSSAPSVRCAVCLSVIHVDYAAGPLTSRPQRAPRPAVSAHGRKRAVVCAVSYQNTPQHLKGCINDANCMKYLLVNRYGFPEQSIIMLTEEETDPNKLPTKRNIRMALYWLIQGCQSGDSLVFHYSGHGSRQRNCNGDEVDGYDKSLWPMDYDSEGMIIGDEFNAAIVRPLVHGVKLHAIIDACHSATMIDLPFLCRMDMNGQYVWEDHQPRCGTWNGTNGGEAISFSGCDDNQTSADTSDLSKITSTGAMTFAFIKAVEQGNGDTYGSILNAMRSTIRNTTGLNQEPQLTSTYSFDAYAKEFSL